MKLLFVCSLLAAKVAATVLEVDLSSGEELRNTSSFVKIKGTEDIRTSDPIYATPAVIYIITDRDILRCLLAKPNVCEVFYKGNSGINDLVISDGYLYAASVSSSILRCDLYKQKSCGTFYTAPGEFEVLSLLVADGYLYAHQYEPSCILRCDLSKSNSCHPFYTSDNDTRMWGLTQIDKFIYLGQTDGKVRRCALREDSCTTIHEIDGTIRSIASTENQFYVLTFRGKLYECSLKFDRTIEGCHHVLSFKGEPGDIKVFNNQMYIAEGGLHICDLNNITNCNSYNAHLFFPRIAIAYETNKIQNRFKNEQKTCPPSVKYYESHERGWFEMHVKNGRLYDSREFLVDTTLADEGHSGPAAIFAMSPAGRLLLSTVHSSQIRTSSFFAGSPVAGAGEMTVINGVIKKMAACDDHYLADAELNKQVIQSLRMKGYTDPIESQTCGEDHENEGIESNIILQ